jgi:Raf kinase inhibitor-like YbhB/YbcL family protein
MSAKTNFFRGAIAIAVNGVPIFNPIKNDGKTDTLIAGELDEYGGHCGRGDDYHYHIAPVHLEQTVGKGKPLAYALDGYPVYGYQQKSDKDYAPLDKLNGHKDAQGNYHYHATKQYPYINGGFYGEVVEAGGQVDPQPRAESPRPALTPLRDAKITDFKETKPGSYVLTYDVRGKKGTVAYTVLQDGSADFTFVDINGKKTTEHYQSKPPRGGPGGNNPPPRRPGEGPPPPKPGEGNRPPRREDQIMKLPTENTPNKNKANTSGMTVSSSSVDQQGMLSVKCTCDGNSLSPAVGWKNAPAGTKSYAVSLWHTAPDMEKSYWVVYNIPATATELKEDTRNVGTVGINDRKKSAYDPMCSKGPGVKTYHITVYAISDVLSLEAKQTSRIALLAAMKGKILAEETFDFNYERKGSSK